MLTKPDTAAGCMATRADAVATMLADAGYARIEPTILQPVSIFLDLSGEDFRGRMFLTSDAAGNELCLRPEYTIPVAREYLASPAAGREAAFSYLGPVFRYWKTGNGELVQAGLENFGRADFAAADAEILALMLEAADAAGYPTLAVHIGDVGLFVSLLAALKLSPLWVRRLRRGFAHRQSLDAIATPIQNGGHDHSGVLAALVGADKRGAHALVEDLLSIAGITSVGGRSAGEIAERYLEQASLKAGALLSAEQNAAISRFLEIEGDPDAASERMHALMQDVGVDLEAELDAFDLRTGFLAARGVEPSRLHFSARFGRNLDYYTGFVFEAHDPARPERRPVLGGGRYDGLLTALGAKTNIPAVGGSLWIDRVEGAGAAPHGAFQ